MEIGKDEINKVLTKYNQLKRIDVHIDLYDSDKIKRQKDIMFGKLVGYE